MKLRIASCSYESLCRVAVPSLQTRHNFFDDDDDPESPDSG